MELFPLNVRQARGHPFVAAMGRPSSPPGLDVVIFSQYHGASCPQKLLPNHTPERAVLKRKACAARIQAEGRALGSRRARGGIPASALRALRAHSSASALQATTAALRCWAVGTHDPGASVAGVPTAVAVANLVLAAGPTCCLRVLLQPPPRS